MSKNNLSILNSKIRRELKKLFDTGAFDKIISLIEDEYPAGGKIKSHYQLIVNAQRINQDDKRANELLCCISTTEDSKGKYSGVSFGVISKITTTEKEKG